MSLNIYLCTHFWSVIWIEMMWSWVPCPAPSAAFLKLAEIAKY